MSKQTNKHEHDSVEVVVEQRPKARPTRAQRKSIIAEALKYEAVQGSPVGDVDRSSSPKVSTDASPSAHYLEPAQASVFSAFVKDVSKTEIDGFDAGPRPNNANYPDKSPANDMTKQCSMIHRMMEMDKTDVDPRDVHKLLPSTMLTSESLDLRPDSVLGRITQGLAGMDLHSLLEDQALKFVAERAEISNNNNAVEEQGDRTPCESSSEEVQANAPPARSSASSEEETTTTTTTEPKASSPPPAPGSPVTGWPAAPVLGIMHPMNHTLCRVPGSNNPNELVAPATAGVTPPAVYSETDASASNAAMACMTRGSPSTAVVLDWTTYAAAAAAAQIYPQPVAYAQRDHMVHALPPLHPHHHHPHHGVVGSEEQQKAYGRAMNYRPATMTPTDANNEAFSHPESKDSDSNSAASDRDRSGGEESAASKKFKSLEAALAWCHVQHSQKQVPVVPKDDVRKLVDFQLNSGKPIRAPWYRPQSDKPEGEPRVEKKPVVEKKPMIPRPERPRRSSSNNAAKKQGTGFFCPPGSSMARV